MSHNFKPGDKVLYIPSHAVNDFSQWEKGIVKSLQDENHVFVVYNCAGNWKKYKNYTAARTNIKYLKLGWTKKLLVKDNKGKWKLIKE